MVLVSLLVTLSLMTGENSSVVNGPFMHFFGGTNELVLSSETGVLYPADAINFYKSLA